MVHDTNDLDTPSKQDREHRNKVSHRDATKDATIDIRKMIFLLLAKSTIIRPCAEHQNTRTISTRITSTDSINILSHGNAGVRRLHKVESS